MYLGVHNVSTHVDESAVVCATPGRPARPIRALIDPRSGRHQRSRPGRSRRHLRRHPRGRPRINAAPPHHQRPRPTGPPTTPIHPAPTELLALVESMDCVMAQHYRRQSTPDLRHLTTSPTGPTGAHRKSWADQRLPPAQMTADPGKHSQAAPITSVHGSRLRADRKRGNSVVVPRLKDLQVVVVDAVNQPMCCHSG